MRALYHAVLDGVNRVEADPRDQLVRAMLSTLHERLAIGVPSVDLPLHAASLALA